MNRKIRFNWIIALAAAFALTTSGLAAQRVSNNENTTNKVSSTRDSKSKKVNVNTASKTDLESLPGVGPAVADNIITARPFKTVNDLKSVSGIGDQRFQEIRPLVTIGSAADRNRDASGAPATSAHASGSDKPGAEAKAKSVIPPGSRSAAGAGTEVTTDSVHSGSDKPGAREKEETRANRSSATSTRGNHAKVNLNTASKAELESLPDIGPVKAQAIIDNRPYKTPQDVMKVPGIKDGIYEEIRDQITVR